MRLLFVTQVLDRRNAILGFTTRWVEGLARRCERVRVLALEVGDTAGLPDNVDWRVVGRRGVLRRYLRYRRQLAEALGRDGFDTLLTHMVPRYSSVAAGPARRAGAGHFLWYTHKGVDERLRRAVEVVDRVFTASEESLRLPTPKRIVTGHGIDLQHFRAARTDERVVAPRPLLLSAGRLTPAKDPLTVLEALRGLLDMGHDLDLEWAGGTLAAGDADYSRQVAARVRDLGLEERVRFLGDVPYTDFPAVQRRATLFLSASRTGSVDKVVLEAMASGTPVVTCNESFPPLLAELGPEADALAFPTGDGAALTRRAAGWLERGPVERAALGQRLRTIVERDHEVDALMGRLVAHMEAARATGGTRP